MAEEPTDDEARGYQPKWMYHRDGRSVLLESEAQEAAILDDKDWSDTPSTFGVVTAPSADDIARMPALAASTGEGADPSLSVLLLQWQSNLTRLEQEQAELRRGLQRAQVDFDKIVEAVTTLAARVDRLEPGGSAPTSRRERRSADKDDD